MSYFPPAELAKTEEVCQREPLAARTRITLLRLEKEAHRAGWDSPQSWPRIYRFERHPQKHYVTAYPADRLNYSLGQALAATGGDVGEALAGLADAMEGARDALGHLGLPTDRDVLIGTRAGQEFYGYGLRNEGWAADLEMLDGEIPAEILEALANKTLHQHVARVETRMVHLVCRDGLRWWCMRRRARPPVECVVMRPEGDLEGAGLVLNALGRMTNAACGNHVPVPATADAEEVVARVRRAAQ